MEHTYKLGKDIVRTVDFAQFPANVIERATVIGMGNILRDCHAGITSESDANFKELSAQAVDEKLTDLLAGVIRESSGGREANPVKRESNRIATEMVTAQYRKAGKKVAQYAKEIRADAAKLALNPKVVALAEKRVAELGELGDIEV